MRALTFEFRNATIPPTPPRRIYTLQGYRTLGALPPPATTTRSFEVQQPLFPHLDGSKAGLVAALLKTGAAKFKVKLLSSALLFPYYVLWMRFQARGINSRLPLPQTRPSLIPHDQWLKLQLQRGISSCEIARQYSHGIPDT